MKIKCPNCKQSVSYNPDNIYRPFCSLKCRMVDLGDWMNEVHNIPDNEMNLGTDLDDGQEDTRH